MQGIYSCFNGIELTESNGSIQSLDVPPNYTHVNMLKMLKTAKDMVSSAQVANSLDNATKTIEEWSRGRENTAQNGFPPAVVTKGMTYTHVPHISSITDKQMLCPQRSLTPTFPVLEKPHMMTRPTPLCYTLPARTSHHVLETTQPVSSLSSPHIAMNDQSSTCTPKPQHGSRVYIENQATQLPLSHFVHRRKLQVSDLYLEHKGPLRRKFSYPHDVGSRQRRPHSYVFDGADPRVRGDYDDPRPSLDELRASPLLNHQTSDASASCIARHYPSRGCSCSFCVKSYLGPNMGNDLLLRRKKLHHRTPFLRATWDSDRICRVDETKTTRCASTPTCKDIPDMFPRVVITNPKTQKIYGALGNSLSYYPLAAKPVYSESAHMCKQKIKHCKSIRLPSYREAVRQNVPELHHSPSSLSHRNFHPNLNSYTDLPAYVGPLAPAANYMCDGSNNMCHLFPCTSACPEHAAMVPRVGNRQVGHHDNVINTYDGWRNRDLGPGVTDQRQVVVAQRVNSPYVAKLWGRMSSPDSEV